MSRRRPTRRALLAGAGAALSGLAGCATRSTGAADGGATTATGDPGGSGGVGDGELVLATTTSTYDTGLLGALNPTFEETTGLRVKTLPKGTGAALRTARDGDADVVLVHARGAEDEFLRDGAGVNRRDVMFNDFVIVGPPDDPAGIAGLESASAGFAAVADAEATFVSRGDDSGTHRKERAIWAAAGVDPGGRWYRSVGQGMGDTLTQAGQTGAYTLADRGTFVSMRDRVDLAIHVQGPLRGGPVLLKNPYGVIPVNPAVHDNVNYRAAMAYVGFLTSRAGQSVIDGYTANGQQLFFPNALSEEPNLAQYVPEGYTPAEAAALSARDRRFLRWVETEVPADY